MVTAAAAGGLDLSHHWSEVGPGYAPLAPLLDHARAPSHHTGGGDRLAGARGLAILG